MELFQISDLSLLLVRVSQHPACLLASVPGLCVCAREGDAGTSGPPAPPHSPPPVCPPGALTLPRLGGSSGFLTASRPLRVPLGQSAPHTAARGSA